jgi:hypothetical protein
MRAARTPLIAASLAVLTGLGLGAAPAQAASAGSATDRLVREWYAGFLGRPADEGLRTSGRAYWVDRLDDGEDPRRILGSILSSAEFAQVTVDGYYETYLGRDSDTDLGSSYWKSGIRADMEPEWVAQNILASPEFEQRHGAQRTEQWYQLVLGRSGSPEEQAYWAGRLQAVGSLGALREVWYSAEAVERRIRDAHTDLLGRQPASVGGGEVDYWYDTAVGSDLGLRVELALTTEAAQDVASD